MKIDSTDSLDHDGAANYQKNIEAVGGRLSLDKKNLIFTAHKVNVQKPSVNIAVSDIENVIPVWTKLFGFIPLLPNAMRVVTKNNSEYTFTVFGRGVWMEKIMRAKDDFVKKAGSA